MPTASNWIKFIYIHLGFIAMLTAMIYLQSAADIKKNWPTYRCNPAYWIYSDDLSADFTYCVQNTQVNIMGELLQPVTYLISSLAENGAALGEGINSSRMFMGNLRSSIGGIVQNVFGVFLNLVIEIQRIIISLKDTVQKTIGIVVTMLYILDGSLKTMQSAWAGPQGQLVRALGSCFHPDTAIRALDGTSYKIHELPLGTILEDGGKVQAVMRLANSEPYYRFVGAGLNGADILVTGSHFVYDASLDTFVKVAHSTLAQLDKATATKPDTEVYSLITSTGHIPIGNKLFWDWEDDVLTHCTSVATATSRP